MQVVFLGMYVHEYGWQCGGPNRGRVLVECLDSTVCMCLCVRVRVHVRERESARARCCCLFLNECLAVYEHGLVYMTVTCTLKGTHATNSAGGCWHIVELLPSFFSLKSV